MIDPKEAKLDQSKSEPDCFPIQREEVARYFFWWHILVILLPTILWFGAGILFAIIYAFTVGKWLPKKESAALRYWLDGSTLRVDQGLYFLRRKAIPLDRISDINLAQGPLLRHFGLWMLKIQTAGAGGRSSPEAILVGLENPEQVRDELLEARNLARSNAQHPIH